MKVRKRKHLDKLQLQWINPPKDRPWARLFIDVLEHEAWRGLSINARRIHDALTCWYVHNHQKENGEIKISHPQFEAVGAARNGISIAIRELTEAAFITTKRTEHAPGSRVLILGEGDTRPILYRLCVYDEAEADGIRKTAKRLFAFVPLDVMESREWFTLSINARRILEHLLVVNIGLCSEHNGQLRVSFRDFAKQGVGMRFIADAIQELVAAGLLAVKPGKSTGLKNPPNFYRLTFLGTIDGPATWRPQPTEAAALSNRKRKAKPMPEKIFSPPPKGDAAPPPKGDAGKANFPPPKSDAVEANSPPPKGDAFIIFLAGNAEDSLPPSPPLSPPNGTNGSSGLDRTDRVTAYAMAHWNWMARYGLPTHSEAGLLRACYGLGETTAAEWSVIEGFIRPKDGKPSEACYTVIGGDRIWIIVDADRKPVEGIDPFESISDAWRHIDRLRHKAGCGPAVSADSGHPGSAAWCHNHTATNTVVATVTLGGDPDGVVVTPGRETRVTTGDAVGSTPSMVAVRRMASCST